MPPIAQQARSRPAARLTGAYVSTAIADAVAVVAGRKAMLNAVTIQCRLSWAYVPDETMGRWIELPVALLPPIRLKHIRFKPFDSLVDSFLASHGLSYHQTPCGFLIIGLSLWHNDAAAAAPDITVDDLWYCPPSKD